MFKIFCHDSVQNDLQAGLAISDRRPKAGVGSVLPLTGYIAVKAAVTPT